MPANRSLRALAPLLAFVAVLPPAFFTQARAVERVITSGSVANAAPLPAVAPVVIVDEWVRSRLALEWTAIPTEHERAYCLTWTVALWAQQLVYRVTNVTRAEETASTHHSVAYRCPPQGNVAVLHTHPSSTCYGADDSAPCVEGGEYAYQCFESARDRLTLVASGNPFALIQCSRHAIVAHFPAQQRDAHE